MSNHKDVLIIGGGIAGLTVANELVNRGIERITVVEAAFCGAGASGRSSGFVTPPSELGLHELRRRYGDDNARLLWNAARDGCESISTTIDQFGIACGRIAADSLYVASSERDFSAIKDEHDTFRDLGYTSTLYPPGDLRSILGTNSYGGGIRFGGTFAIDPYDYLQGLARQLRRRGVEIVEHSRVKKISPSRAEKIFVCADFAAARMHVAKPALYHAQTFIVMTEPLRDDVLHSLFPRGPMLVWDSDLIYTYFRLTADRRLLVGGGLLTRTYLHSRPHDRRVIRHIVRTIRDRFPVLENVKFEFDWNGLIGVTKDLLPVAGRVRDNVYVALCAAGLPWSVAAAKSAVRVAYDGSDPLERFFAPRRRFVPFDFIQPVVRKPLTFAISHAYVKAGVPAK